jgi:hypothetical protein
MTTDPDADWLCVTAGDGLRPDALEAGSRCFSRTAPARTGCRTNCSASRQARSRRGALAGSAKHADLRRYFAFRRGVFDTIGVRRPPGRMGKANIGGETPDLSPATARLQGALGPQAVIQHRIQTPSYAAAISTCTSAGLARARQAARAVPHLLAQWLRAPGRGCRLWSGSDHSLRMEMNAYFLWLQIGWIRDPVSRADARRAPEALHYILCGYPTWHHSGFRAC